MKIKCYSWDNKVIEEEFNDEDVLFLHVCVVSGDEIIKVYYKDEETGDIDFYQLDHGGRTCDFMDDEYIVQSRNIPKWNTRADSYDCVWPDNDEC